MSYMVNGVKSSVLQWVHEGDTVSKVGFALIASLAVNGILLFEGGISEFPVGALAYLPAALAIILSVVISPEAYSYGFGRTMHFWKQMKGRLVVLLSAALIVRGVGVGLAAAYLGFDTHTLLLIATGLTATDPAAISIALALAGKEGNPIRLEEVFWLYSMESLINDGIASAAFEIASGESVALVLEAVALTAFLGITLALSDEGARWYIREKSRWARTSAEAKVEILFVLLIYAGFAAVAQVIGAFPIMTVVVGAVVADYFFIHRLPGDRYSDETEREREHFAHLWAEWGLAFFLFLSGSLMPYSVFWNHPEYLKGGLIILLPGIVGTRFLYDAGYIALNGEERSHPLSFRLSAMSVLLAGTLLGVPTFVGASLYEEGLHDAAYYVFSAILESWAIVPLAVWYIARLRGRLVLLSR